MDSDYQAVVLVGGLGTRLGEITRVVPKPMLPVGNKPFLEYLIRLLVREGVRRVHFCTSHLAGVVGDHFGDGAKFGVAISYSHEPSPLGTGGALVLAADQLDKTFFVLNGDTIFDAPLSPLYETLAADANALGVLALRSVADAGRYGSVNLAGSTIIGFREKGQTGAGPINGGIYCLRREALKSLPAGQSSLERDLFPRLAASRQLHGQVCDGYFIDIGIPEDLARAEIELPCVFPT